MWPARFASKPSVDSKRLYGALTKDGGATTGTVEWLDRIDVYRHTARTNDSVGSPSIHRQRTWVIFGGCSAMWGCSLSSTPAVWRHVGPVRRGQLLRRSSVYTGDFDNRFPVSDMGLNLPAQQLACWLRSQYLIVRLGRALRSSTTFCPSASALAILWPTIRNSRHGLTLQCAISERSALSRLATRPSCAYFASFAACHVQD